MAKEVPYTIKSHVMIPITLVVLIFPQVLGFHQPPSLFLIQNGATASPKGRSIASINELGSPPCLQASAEGSGAEAGASKTARATAVAPLSLPMLFEEGPLRILDPAVRETDKGYSLSFNLPSEVTEDGLDLSVRLVILRVSCFELCLVLFVCFQSAALDKVPIKFGPSLSGR